MIIVEMEAMLKMIIDKSALTVSKYGAYYKRLTNYINQQNKALAGNGRR